MLTNVTNSRAAVKDISLAATVIAMIAAGVAVMASMICQAYSIQPVSAATNPPAAAQAAAQQEAATEDVSFAAPTSDPDPQAAAPAIAPPQPQFGLCREVEAHRALLDAIRKVETNGREYLVGDGGRSRGGYQIGRKYWMDACRQGGLNWSYDRWSTNRDKSERIIVLYWQHYGAATDEQRARLHNGGPEGVSKSGTLHYWSRVRAELSHAAVQ